MLFNDRMWGAQSRTPFGAPVGQRGGHRSTCRTHTHPFQGPHDQGHRSSPGRAGPRWPFPSCCRTGKPGVTRARLRVYVSSEEHVVCPARPSSSRGCARGLEGIGGSCVLARQTEARAPDVRSRRLGPEQPYLACSAEARRSVRGTAPWLALCPACSHLGQREGVEPAGHCPSPAGPPPPECTGFTLPRSPPPARGGIGGDRPRSGHGTQVSSCPRCQGRGQTPHGAGPGWWRTGHTALPTEPPAATPPRSRIQWRRWGTRFPRVQPSPCPCHMTHGAAMGGRSRRHPQQHRPDPGAGPAGPPAPTEPDLGWSQHSPSRSH